MDGNIELAILALRDVEIFDPIGVVIGSSHCDKLRSRGIVSLEKVLDKRVVR